jgi:hypothetical protein
MTAGLPEGKVDYNKMGLGSLANAFGIGEGTTGKRPWADREYSSLGGDALNFLQFAEGNGTAQPSQTWGSQPIPTAPSGGGAALSPPPSAQPDPAIAAQMAEEQRKKALALQTGGGNALMGA